MSSPTRRSAACSASSTPSRCQRTRTGHWSTRCCSGCSTAPGCSPGFARCAGSLVCRVCAAHRLLDGDVTGCDRCGATTWAGVSPGSGCVVELGHEFAVGGTGGGEFFAAFFELQPQIDDLLFQVVDLLVEGVDVGGGAEPGLAPCLGPECLRQASFQVLEPGVEPDGAFVSGEQVCLQRGSGDRRA